MTFEIMPKLEQLLAIQADVMKRGMARMSVAEWREFRTREMEIAVLVTGLPTNL